MTTCHKLVRKVKVSLLVAFAGGAAFASACSAVDIRHNVIAGTQSFVKSWVTDLWGVLVPPADDLFGDDQ